MPAVFTAGATWEWSQAVSTTAGDPIAADSGATVTLYLIGASNVTVVATAQTTDWLFSLTAARSGVVIAGAYRWTLRAELDGKTYECGAGRLDVLANPGAVAGSDGRSVAAQMVERIDAELLARITGDGSAHSDYTIGTRQISKMPVADLRIMRAVYQAEAQREQHGGRLAPYKAHFVRP